MRDITESDWRIFKGLRELALERFCERILGEIARIGLDTTKTNHERYLAIYRLVRERDKEIVPIFDYLQRSTAVRQICALRSHDLLTAQELRQFSPELVKWIEDRRFTMMRTSGRPSSAAIHPFSQEDGCADQVRA
jgi:hypothetical protein